MHKSISYKKGNQVELGKKKKSLKQNIFPVS